MTNKDTYEKQTGKNNEIYLHCRKCNCTFLWTPHLLNRYKGEVGTLSIAAIEYTSAPLCKGCMSLIELFFTIRNLKESMQLIEEANN